MLIMHCFLKLLTPSYQRFLGPCTVIDENLMCCIFVCACSPSGQSHSGAVCVGDGVASEHRPGQKLHLALLRERPAAGDASHRRLGFRTTVSFNAPAPASPPLPSRSVCCPHLSTTWPLECAQWTWQPGFLLDGVEWTQLSGKGWGIFGALACEKSLFIMTTQSILRPQQHKTLRVASS